MPSRPFTLKVHAPSGDADGVLAAFRDDWPGKAIIFPREALSEARLRPEFGRPGVYLLIGDQKLYIGEGDPVGKRLDDHARRKPFWTRAVFFTAEAGRLHKAHIQHLEARLVGLAKKAGRVELDNGNTPELPELSEEERAFAENFLEAIQQTLSLLGFRQLTPRNGAAVDPPVRPSRPRPTVPVAIEAAPAPAPAEARGIGFELAGKFYPGTNGRDVLIQVFELLSQRDPTFLERFAALPEHGRTRRYLAQTALELYPERADLAPHSAQLSSGWWVGTNLSHEAIQRVIKMACEVAGLGYERELVLTLSA